MLYRLTLCALSAVLLLPTLPAQITVDPLPAVTFCGSAPLNVGFSTSGAYNAGNVFTVELSDSTGSFDAPTVIGSIAGTTSGSIPCTFPTGVVGGHAIRVVASDPAQVGEAYGLPIVTFVPPNAGTGGVVILCSNAAPVPFLTLWGGDPDPGGWFNDPTGVVLGSWSEFDPASSPAGCYVYTVDGPPPCQIDQSVMCVQVHPAPEAGNSDSVTWCTSWGPFNMLDHLAGTPMPGGAWAYAAGPHSSVFDPAIDPPGEYLYTVPGTAPCDDATATLTVTLMAVCVTGPQSPFPVE